MNHRLSTSGILAVALLGCQNPEYVNPDEENTGNPPRDASTVFAFDAASAPAYLDGNLVQSNAVSAQFVNTEAGITIMPVNGELGTAGDVADLRGGVGFGTYVNSDYRLPVDWAGAGDFEATVTANVAFTSVGDSVMICRSFATTCVELIHGVGPAGASIAILRLAANIPDTEIGEISEGVSAAVRGTGPNGLTIALTDPTAVGAGFLATAGTPFDVAWTTGRGALEGSLDWSLAINGTEIAAGNTLTDMATSIVKTGGVAMIFDTPLNHGGDPMTVEYYTEFEGYSSDYYHEPWVYWPDPDDTNPPISMIPTDLPVGLAARTGLEHAPLYVYTTTDGPYEFATYDGVDGLPHGVEWQDGVVGMAMVPEGSSSQHFVYSTAFDGDDFAGTPFATFIDQDTVGGGFYPSPAFCYSQIVPVVEASVRAGVRQEIHRTMYSRIATGVAQADGESPFSGGLPALVAGINGTPALHAAVGADLVYTNLTVDDLKAIGTDYADNNVDANIATSAGATYNVTLTQSVSTTFRTQLAAVNDALLLDVGGDFIWEHLGLNFNSQVVPLLTLEVGLTTPPGVKDGYFDGEEPVYDDFPPYNFGDCQGYECNVQWILRDVMIGDNDLGVNAGEGLPALGAACLWGLPPTAAVAATDAVLNLDGNFFNDAPAYPAVPAAAATPPVREVAAASMNTLVMGMYGNFYTAVFGPGIPASNFSLTMTAGDPTAATGPLLTSLTITSGAAPAE